MVITTVFFFIVGTSLQANRLRTAAVETISSKTQELHSEEEDTPVDKGEMRPRSKGVRPQQDQVAGADQVQEFQEPKNGDPSFIDKFIDKGITTFWAIVQAVIVGITMARVQRRKRQEVA